MKWLVILSVVLFAACSTGKAATPTDTATAVPATATPDVCRTLMMELALSTTETAASVITGELRHYHCLASIP